VISKSNYKRITVPPNIWFGFKGIGKENNLVVNLSNVEHADDEVERKQINELNYQW
jgi:dTDP-4-dehydrorhamnose 3,5-epimerase